MTGVPPSSSPINEAPQRSGVLQAALTVAVGIVAFVTGTFLYSLFVGGPGALGPDQIGAGILSLLLSPAVLTWALATLTVGVIARRAKPRVITTWALALTPVATIVGILFRWPETFSDPGTVLAPMFWVMLLWQTAGLFGAGLIGCLVGEATRRGKLSPVSTVAGGLLLVGAVVAFALPTQWLGMNFALGGQTPDPTPAEINRYLVAAIVAAAFLVAALVVALLARVRTLITMSAVVLGLTVVGFLVFLVTWIG